ncbi:hypothetical protein B4098_2675 [Heyndrickxia coagulans]|uniref:Uncharacterized protein n=1 Tax=Heyndrickxia coagulans TaxID=1398 RepID=A0A150KLH6_HEYCO|nr:hypothetical protein B4098_2675 [Heyndrickxia coagulans]KYC73843.1 hypothetical protein B4099_2804 [Heyndrickxia coagulans]
MACLSFASTPFLHFLLTYFIITKIETADNCLQPKQEKDALLLLVTG